jgi:hypothetical protein
MDLILLIQAPPSVVHNFGHQNFETITYVSMTPCRLLRLHSELLLSLAYPRAVTTGFHTASTTVVLGIILNAIFHRIG